MTLRGSILQLGGLLLAAAFALGAFTLYDRTRTGLADRETQDAEANSKATLEVLELLVEKGRHGQVQEALAELRSLEIDRLSPEIQTRHALAVADLHFHFGCSPECRNPSDHFTVARYNYGRAGQLLAEDDDPARRHRTRCNLLEMDLRERLFDQVLVQTRSLAGESGWSPRQQTQFGLIRARALAGLGRDDEAAAEIERVLDAYDMGELRIQALLLQARLAMDQAVASGFDRRPEQRTDPVDPDGAVVLERAREALEEALLLLRAGDARRGPALNDLLQLAVWEEDPEEAYARLEALERASLRGSERVRSLLLISELEARLGNADEAILPLKIAVRDYPWEAKAPDVYTRLYTFYKRQGDLDSALAVLEKWVLLVTEADEALPLLACFLPGDDSLVLDLATVPDRRSLFIRSDVLLQSLRRPQDPRWQVNDETVLFLRGYLAYAGESYREAERRFAHYLGVSRNRDFVEQALYYDMLCGLLTAKPAAVRAYRANRYLATCSENPRSREALLNLLQAYYEMGLYHATLSAAKAAFVNEVVRMGVSDREERREHWLRSVAQVAQCYNHLGFHDRANQLFRSFGSQLRLLRAPGSVYLDWARTAFELGQQREGIRRLRVAEDWVVDPETRLRMQVAREMHSLTHGVTDDPGPLLEKMDRIRSLAVSDPDTYRPLLRNLYEELLDYLSSKSPDRVAVVLHELLTDFPAETDGTEYWLLRYLTDRLDTMPADEVSQGMEQVLAVLDPDTTRAFECAQQGTAAVRGLARLQEQMREIEQRGLTHEQ